MGMCNVIEKVMAESVTIYHMNTIW